MAAHLIKGKAFLDLFQACAGMLIIILLGFICAWGKLLDKSSMLVVNKITFWVALPCLMFKTLAGSNFVKLPWRFSVVFLIIRAIMIGACALYMLIFERKHKEPFGRYIAILIGTTWMSPVIYGQPILAALYPGSAAVTPLPVLASLSSIFFQLPFMLLVYEYQRMINKRKAAAAAADIEGGKSKASLAARSKSGKSGARGMESLSTDSTSGSTSGTTLSTYYSDDDDESDTEDWRDAVPELKQQQQQQQGQVQGQPALALAGSSTNKRSKSKQQSQRKSRRHGGHDDDDDDNDDDEYYTTSSSFDSGSSSGSQTTTESDLADGAGSIGRKKSGSSNKGARSSSRQAAGSTHSQRRRRIHDRAAGTSSKSHKASRSAAKRSGKDGSPPAASGAASGAAAGAAAGGAKAVPPVHRRHDFMHMATMTFINPVLILTIIGAIWAGAGGGKNGAARPIPLFLDTVVTNLGNMVTPLAMFEIGLFIYFVGIDVVFNRHPAAAPGAAPAPAAGPAAAGPASKAGVPAAGGAIVIASGAAVGPASGSVKDWRVSSRMSIWVTTLLVWIVKHAALPLLCVGICYAMDVKGYQARSAVILAALPVSVAGFTLAVRYHTQADVMAVIIAIGNITMVVALAMVLGALEGSGIFLLPDAPVTPTATAAGAASTAKPNTTAATNTTASALFWG